MFLTLPFFTFLHPSYLFSILRYSFHFDVSFFSFSRSCPSPASIFLLLSPAPHFLFCDHIPFICLPSFQCFPPTSKLRSVLFTPHSRLPFSSSYFFSPLSPFTFYDPLSPAPSLCCCSMSSPALSCATQTYCWFVPIVLPAKCGFRAPGCRR